MVTRGQREGEMYLGVTYEETERDNTTTSQRPLKNPSCWRFLNVIPDNPIKLIFFQKYEALYKGESPQKEQWAQSQGHRLCCQLKQILCSTVPELTACDFPHLGNTASCTGLWGEDGS